MGKKSKGGGKKKQNKEVKDALPEVDKEFFEIQIADLNKKLTRLKAYSQQLENENEDLRHELETLDADRNDVIALLKRRLYDKIEEIQQLTARSKALQEAKHAEKKFLKNYIKKRETETKLMHEQLISEIKLLHGKLNSLEEFKIHRDELTSKFAIQEEALEEQEKRHKQTLYEVEKKFIISKDKLRKDMEERLLKLSLDFQKATQTRIASTTQSVIRENIAINNELSLLIGSWQKLFDENENLKEKTRSLTNEIELANNQKSKALSRNVLQAQVIDRLAFEHQQIGDMYTEVKQNKDLILVLEEKLAVAERTADCCQQDLNKILQDKENLEIKFKDQTRQFNKLCNINYNIEKKVKIAIFTIKQAIRLGEKKKNGTITAEKEEAHRTELLNSLLELFSCEEWITVTTPKMRSVSVETIGSWDNRTKYTRGNLGIFGQGMDQGIERQKSSAELSHLSLMS